ncbi:alpha/beta hydrolase [Spongiactinospora sp. TRM90649]|uniref:alpha/beta hydrolase n=1 Tax=Spongiactinospora sp. TRM90649 TaxID=3031114 RepID=UPI0023F6C64A|nr:alpha/beta hydrolase [Spongiactinospora sp. TRM90649]MDF5756235.1 alpha/beta hydrolase [Spongiactinospora sp. TRM90649]
MNKLIGVGLAAAMLTGMTGLTTVPATAATPGESEPIVFGACPEPLAKPYPELTCAVVPVPLDYANPDGGTVNLMVSRRASTDPDKRKGVLFVNPGGPGGSSSERAGRLSKADAQGRTRLPQEVLDAYDIIGMDPRGVGLSQPVSCVHPDFWQGPRPDPDDQANRDKIWNDWQTFAQECGRKQGTRLKTLGTRNVARDMDRVLSLLGEKKLNYLGYSYGTYLGAVYATLFPDRVGRMILDSNMNPEPREFYRAATVAQVEPLQRRVDAWLAWTARYDDVFHLGDTRKKTRAAWDATLAAFRTPHGTVGADELLGTVSGLMYDESGWQALAQSVADFTLRQDDAGLVELAGSTPSVAQEQGIAAFSSVMCVDAAWPSERAAYESDAARFPKSFQFAWYNIGNATSCANWPAGHEERVLPTGKGLPKILMFNNVDDPATPYRGALGMHRSLPTSVLVTALNAGRHGVFANPIAQRNTDAQRIGAAYLVDGVLPRRDIVIPGHKLPVPTADRVDVSTVPTPGLLTVE